jgi:PAS domain S-box-containing protein
MMSAVDLPSKLPTLLVVDDDPEMRIATAGILERAGYAVIQGATAAEALTLTRTHRPALVLLDVMLPDGDGRDIARQLKSDKDLSGVFVVLLTGTKFNAEDQSRGLLEGLADGYLVHPVPPKVLCGWIGAFLRLRSMQESLQLRTHELAERVKELNCLYRLSDLAESNQESLEGLLQGMIELLSPAWQYPSIACARITLGGLTFSTVNFKQTQWRQQRPIRLHVAQVGSVEVCYLEARPDRDEGPFLRQEGQLLEAIAERLGKAADRIQARQALRESEARMRAITDSGQDAILMMDPEGRVSFWNPAAERIFGYTSAETLGLDLHELIVPPRYHEAHKVAFPGFRQTGQGGAIGRTLDVEARRKDGLEIAVQLSLSAVHMNGDWHAIGLIRDITERKRAESEREAANENLHKAMDDLHETNLLLEEATARANAMALQAEQANTSKSQFLANMSHEIRTPMNGVIGMTGLLLDSELTGEQRQYAEVVRTSGEALLALINDILDFSKIEAQKLELELLDFDLNGVLEDTAELLALKAHEKGLEIVCLVEPEVPLLLRGDPGRLRQIVLNLGGNAVKFTHRGGIMLYVSLVAEDQRQVTVRVAVTDSGIGIPPEKQEKLFSPFVQVDGSTSRKYGGTGLGLAISKQLAELMGGVIGIESPSTELRISGEASGSTFWFTAVFEKQAAGQADATMPVADVSGAHVLVVDDNNINRLLVTTLLKKWGCRFAEAIDGLSALERLREAVSEMDPYDVALLDRLMPGMDGAELGRRIKESAEIRETRLMMMTSLAGQGERARLTELGFAGYLTKPLRHSQLRECLAIVLGRAEASATRPIGGLAAGGAKSGSQKAGARILLAEDNAINQLVALKILGKLGYRADAVANGLEVIKALESIPYDLVLMDCQMPEMDGFEATRAIRNLKMNIPVIAMTANAMKGDRELCLEAGMNDYLSKPVKPAELGAALERWLNGD